MYQISVTRLSSTVCYQVKIDEIFFLQSSSHGISEKRLHEAACTAGILGMQFQLNVAIIYMI